MSLSSLNRSFNDVACIDHFHLGNMRICHMMDAATRYSAGAVVPHTRMESAINVLDSHWISQFWASNSMQSDQAFDNEIFLTSSTCTELNLVRFQLVVTTKTYWNQNIKSFEIFSFHLILNLICLLKLCVLDRQSEFQLICTEMMFVLHMS